MQVCCKYVFSSKRDEGRHYHLVHPIEFRNQQRHALQERRAQKRAATGTGASLLGQFASKRFFHRCTFDGCGAVFSSYYQLTHHNQKEGHTMARGRPRKKQTIILQCECLLCTVDCTVSTYILLMPFTSLLKVLLVVPVFIQT